MTEACTQGIADELVRTRARYLVTAPLEAVRAFFREAFEAHGWVVVDVHYRAERWRYFATHGTREAKVALRTQAELVAIKLDVTEPATPTTAAIGLYLHR